MSDHSPLRPSLSLPKPPGPPRYERIPASEFSSNVMKGVRLGYRERVDKAAGSGHSRTDDATTRARVNALREAGTKNAPYVAEHTRGTNAVVDMAADVVKLRADRDEGTLGLVEIYGAMYGLQRLAYVLAGSVELPYHQHLESPDIALASGSVPTGNIRDSLIETSALVAQMIPLLQEIRNNQEALQTGVTLFKEAVLGEGFETSDLVHIAEMASPYGDLASALARAHLSD